MLNVVHDTRARAIHALAKPAYTPFRAAPVMHPDPGDPQRAERRKTHLTAVASYLYIFRLAGRDHLGPLPPDYLAKADDLVAAGRRHRVQHVPVVLQAGPQIWIEADAATMADPEHAAAVHVILSLPNLPRHKWQPLVERFIDDRLVARGMIVDWAIHSKRDEDGEWTTHPHVHLICTARRWKSDQRKGQRMHCWLFSKAQIDALEAAWLSLTGLPPAVFATG